MKSNAKNVEEYLAELPEERKAPMLHLRAVILKNMPSELEETMSYGMIGYVIPHKVYPKGYHCDPKLPLPFINLASQKNYISFYHMGLYEDTSLYNWFTAEYPKYSSRKLNMGKCCVRFTNMTNIPYQLIGELLQKGSVESYIVNYEKQLASHKK